MTLKLDVRQYISAELMEIRGEPARNWAGVIYVANELAHSYVTVVSLFFKNLLWNIMNFVGFKYNTHTYSTLVSLGNKPLLEPIVNTIICYRTMYWKPSHVHAHISWWRHQNGNIFRVIGPLCGEFTGHRWITLIKTSDAELWCFFYRSMPEQTVEYTIETPVIWDAIALIIWR